MIDAILDLKPYIYVNITQYSWFVTTIGLNARSIVEDFIVASDQLGYKEQKNGVIVGKNLSGKDA